MSNNSSTVVEVPVQALQTLEGAVEAAGAFLSYSLNSLTVELVLFGGLSPTRTPRTVIMGLLSLGAYSLLIVTWVFPVM